MTQEEFLEKFLDSGSMFEWVNAKEREIADKDRQIKELKAKVEYWKLSFKKQCEATK